MRRTFGFGWLAALLLAGVPLAASAQAPVAESGASSAPGILAVIGFAALLAAGIYFWARTDDSGTPGDGGGDEAPSQREADESGA